MMKVVVTGANGFVGRFMVRDLQQKGYDVIAAVRNVQQNSHSAVLDFTSPRQVKEVIGNLKPHIIIHCGAISKPDECELNKEAALLVNVKGTEYLLAYAEKYKAHFIFLSTDFVFDGTRSMHTEEEEPSAVNFYGHTKLMAEKLVNLYNGPSTIVRTVMVYGNPMGGRDNIVTLTKKKLEKGELFKVVNDQLRTPTYVEDLSAGIATIAEKKATGIYHLCGNEMTSPYEIALAVADLLSLDKTLLQKVTANTFKEIARRPLLSGLDISKAKKELNFLPISLQEGIRQTFSCI